ncbi:unnamed protein product [Dibothriocephalus latus]|uniref:Septin-type G domain-containing protein n=1 Tax=Dibothriocephalus latus TaxID=60516 RepID=A0A3P6PF79_DIBLA|nr:unnamed protein product [Dibothriocephalus latus]
MVNSLFMQDLYKDREEVDANERIHKVTKIEKRQIELDERGVKLRLTIVDTPGFNDAVNAEEWSVCLVFSSSPSLSFSVFSLNSRHVLNKSIKPILMTFG